MLIDRSNIDNEYQVEILPEVGNPGRFKLYIHSVQLGITILRICKMLPEHFKIGPDGKGLVLGEDKELVTEIKSDEPLSIHRFVFRNESGGIAHRCRIVTNQGAEFALKVAQQKYPLWFIKFQAEALEPKEV